MLKKITYSVAFLVLINYLFYYNLKFCLSNISELVFTFFTPLFLTLIILSFEVIWVTKFIKSLFKKSHFDCTPMITSTVTVFALVLLVGFDSELVNKNEIKFQACREGTQNTARLFFLKDNTFKAQWQSILNTSIWRGNWRMQGDTIFINYFCKKLEVLGDTAIILNNEIFSISTYNKRPRSRFGDFYLGECRHEN